MDMKITEAEMEFPNIDGYMMHSHVDSHSPILVSLWFYQHAPDLSSIINIHLFLVGARMVQADVELNPFFPTVVSYSVEQSSSQAKGDDILKIKFERGEISFSFQKVFYVKNTQPIGHIPDELKKLIEES